MTTCRDIITHGMKLARILSPGEPAQAEEAADGLFVLQGMFDAYANGGMFGRLTDVLKDSDYEAKEWERVVSSATVTLPATIGEGTEERPPYDLAAIEKVESGVRSFWIYDRSGWVRIDNLTLDTICPLAARGRDGLAAAFAVRFVGLFGDGLVSPEIQLLGRQFIGSLASKLGTERRPVQTVYF